MNRQEQAKEGVRRTVIRTVAVLLGMFGFAFALVPLYDVFCQITGINGKVDLTAKSIVHEEVDESRYINVQFITRGSAGLPWHMAVEMRQMSVHPGQMAEVDFTFTNNSPSESWGRAVPSVSPSSATTHLRKISCFCFEEQQLYSNERLTISLIFQVARDLPADINTITLVYTLYPVDRVSENISLNTLINERPKQYPHNEFKSAYKNNKVMGETI